jgi:hypothetical protein
MWANSYDGSGFASRRRVEAEAGAVLRQQDAKLRRHQSPSKLSGQFGSPSKAKPDGSWRVDPESADQMEGDAQLNLFLRSIDLEHYAATLHREEVNMGVMEQLGEDELKELGIVTVGARRRMLGAISQLPSGSYGYYHR